MATALATAALARLGVAQIAFDTGARVMAADPLAETLVMLTPDPGGRPGRRLQMRPESARRLEAACAALAVAALLVLVKGLGLRVVVRFSSSEPPAQSAGDTRSRLLAP